MKQHILHLKKGKAVSEDLILNELFISLDEPMPTAVLNVFNHCLTLDTYPWTTSLVTPLHKKENVYDPNDSCR